MADPLPPQERLQPALLDRLTDDEPDKKVEPREARVLSKRRLRESVLRDLTWLFNATQLEAVDPLDKVPNVRRSVVNFGLPALSGSVASSLDITDLTRAIRQAILTFEPRILPHTLKVHAERVRGDSHNVLGFRIEGQLWSQPVPLEIYMRTEIDLESGLTNVVESKAR